MGSGGNQEQEAHQHLDEPEEPPSPVPGQRQPASLTINLGTNGTRRQSDKESVGEPCGPRDGSGPNSSQGRRNSSKSITSPKPFAMHTVGGTASPLGMSNGAGNHRYGTSSPNSSRRGSRRMSWTNSREVDQFINETHRNSHSGSSSNGRKVSTESTTLEIETLQDTLYPPISGPASNGSTGPHKIWQNGHNSPSRKYQEQDVVLDKVTTLPGQPDDEEYERSLSIPDTNNRGNAGATELVKAESVDESSLGSPLMPESRDRNLIESALSQFSRRPSLSMMLTRGSNQRGSTRGSIGAVLTDPRGSKRGSVAPGIRRESTETPEFMKNNRGRRSSTFYKRKWNEAIWYAAQQAQEEKRKKMESPLARNVPQRMGTMVNLSNSVQKASKKLLSTIRKGSFTGSFRRQQSVRTNSSGVGQPINATQSSESGRGYVPVRQMTVSSAAAMFSHQTADPSGSKAAPRKSRISSFNGSDGEPNLSAMNPPKLGIPDKVAGFMVRVLESRRMFMVQFICVLIVVAIEDCFIVMDESWARNEIILYLQFVAFVVLSVEHLARAAVSATYIYSVQSIMHGIITITMIYEMAWLFGRYDFFSDLLGMDSRLSNLGARTVGWGLRIAFLLNMILRWYGRNFLLVAEMGSEKSVLARHKVKQDGNQFSVNSLLETRLSHWIHRDLALMAAIMLFLSHGLSTATQPNRTHGLVTVLDTLLTLHQQFHNSSVPNNPYEVAESTFIKGMDENNGMPVVFITINDVFEYGNMSEAKKHPLVEIDMKHTTMVNGIQETIVLGFKDKNGLYYDAVLHLAGLFSCALCLILGSDNLMHHIKERVVAPTDSLLNMVEQLTIEPLKPLALSHQASKSEESAAVQAGLMRIATLLQVAFGEAGAQIMRSQMSNGQLDYNNMPGSITRAIFGFCDIRNFTDLTEVLQADVSKVVNSVAAIVHESVVDNYGSPNKNIGDAFLMVWKPRQGMRLEQGADAALRSYIRIILELSRSETLKTWADKPGIQKRLPGFRIKLGFGLHFGWAVECAIGSKRKIEASYLSPHVNMASRLESATKMYGVEILISDDTYKLFSDDVREKCRLIDRVTVKGSSNPLSLYTYDIPSFQKFGGQLHDDTDISAPDMSSEEFYKLCKPELPERFVKKFTRAINLYIGHTGGLHADWREAMKLLRDCLTMVPGDGPCKLILSYMEDNASPEGSTPPYWHGFRSLTEK